MITVTTTATRTTVWRVRCKIDGREYQWYVDDRDDAEELAVQVFRHLDVIPDITQVLRVKS